MGVLGNSAVLRALDGADDGGNGLAIYKARWAGFIECDAYLRARRGNPPFRAAIVSPAQAAAVGFIDVAQIVGTEFDSESSQILDA
jgi:hypothetical protein